MSARATATAAAGAGVALLLLTACASSNPGQGVGGPTRTGPHSSAATSVPTATTGSSPDAAESTALVAALGSVDPALVSDPAQAVTRSMIVCAQLQDGGDVTTVVPPAFSDVTLNPTQVTAVATAIRTTFCR